MAPVLIISTENFIEIRLGQKRNQMIRTMVWSEEREEATGNGCCWRGYAILFDSLANNAW